MPKDRQTRFARNRGGRAAKSLGEDTHGPETCRHIERARLADRLYETVHRKSRLSAPAFAAAVPWLTSGLVKASLVGVAMGLGVLVSRVLGDRLQDAGRIDPPTALLTESAGCLILANVLALAADQIGPPALAGAYPFSLAVSALIALWPLTWHRLNRPTPVFALQQALATCAPTCRHRCAACTLWRLPTPASETRPGQEDP